MNHSYIFDPHNNTMRALLLGAMVVVVSLSLVLVQEVFAIHASDEMTWQLVMISSYPACSNYHYQMTEKYFLVTTEYFKLYQFDNTSLKPLCLTEKKFNEEYKPDEEIDLLIIVYDRNKGRAELNAQDIGGFYSHVGNEWTNNHTIVLCDCPNFRFSEPVWILSHELSHFILYYLGYDRTITEDHVHKLDTHYDYCIEVEYSPDCIPAIKIIDIEYSRFSVMPPVEEAIGKKLIKDVQVENVIDSPFRVELQKEITQWWLDGKISDNDYQKSLELVLGKMGKTTEQNRNEFFAADARNIILTDPPNDKKHISEAHTERIDISTERSRKMLKMSPFGEEYYSSISNPKEQFPQWFKTRAVWWTAGKIDTSEFLSGMDFLYSNSMVKELSKTK